MTATAEIGTGLEVPLDQAGAFLVNVAAIGAAEAARSAAEAVPALGATAAAATNSSADAGQTVQRG